MPRVTINCSVRGFHELITTDSRGTMRTGISSSEYQSKPMLFPNMPMRYCSSRVESRGVLAKLNTRNGQVRTAALAATPPTIERKNERRFMRLLHQSLLKYRSAFQFSAALRGLSHPLPRHRNRNSSTNQPHQGACVLPQSLLAKSTAPRKMCDTCSGCKSCLGLSATKQLARRVSWAQF